MKIIWECPDPKFQILLASPRVPNEGELVEFTGVVNIPDGRYEVGRIKTLIYGGRVYDPKWVLDTEYNVWLTKR